LGASSALSMDRVRPCRFTWMFPSWLLVSLVYNCSVSWRISSSVATELPDDWKAGRTVVVLASTLCGPKDTPWAGVGGTEGVCADEDEGVGGITIIRISFAAKCWISKTKYMRPGLVDSIGNGNYAIDGTCIKITPFNRFL